MSDDFTQAFEHLWVALRARWCDSHDLDGALAFTHDQVKIPFFHRIVQGNCAEVDRLIDDALSLYREKDYDCIFTLSPLARPTALGQRLQPRGFTAGSTDGVDLPYYRRYRIDKKEFDADENVKYFRYQMARARARTRLGDSNISRAAAAPSLLI